eukprot:4960133-Amphidinium_carterae.1
MFLIQTKEWLPAKVAVTHKEQLHANKILCDATKVGSDAARTYEAETKHVRNPRTKTWLQQKKLRKALWQRRLTRQKGLQRMFGCNSDSLT